MPKINFVGSLTVPHEYLMASRESSRKRGFQRVEQQEVREGRLAVVGGGPSLLQHLDKIRECSEVWGINGACGFLRSHGIESTLFSMDPDPIVVKWVSGATKALLCDRVCPEAFEALGDSSIRVFELLQDSPEGIYTGSSTASGAFSLGVKLGWAYIDFFGCESSFESSSHAYQDEEREELIWVEVDGVEYKTAPDFYLQAMEMSQIIRHFPKHYRHFGGGLLQALIDHPEHDIPHVSPAMKARLVCL